MTLYTILFTYASCVPHLCFRSFFLTVFCQKHKYAISQSNLWLLRLVCTIYSEPISLFLSQVLQLSVPTKIIILQCILFFIVLHYLAKSCIVLRVIYCPVLHCITLRCFALHRIELYSVVFMLCYIIFYYNILYCIVLHCITLYCFCIKIIMTNKSM